MYSEGYSWSSQPVVSLIPRPAPQLFSHRFSTMYTVRKRAGEWIPVLSQVQLWPSTARLVRSVTRYIHVVALLSLTPGNADAARPYL